MAYKPPRDHAESIRMLKAEEDRLARKGNARFVWDGLTLLLAMLGFVVCIGAVVAGLFGFLR